MRLINNIILAIKRLKFIVSDLRNVENSSHLDAIRLTRVLFYLPVIFVLVLQRLPVISELLSLPGGGLVAGQICWLNGEDDKEL